jgi:DNA-binding LacI/PurR family transcriptional regulator
MSQGLSQNLALEFRRKIETGQWGLGKRLPTTRELAAEYQVSANTIQGAFRMLEAHGLVDRRPRRGGFVKLPSTSREMSKATAVGFVGVFAQLSEETDADEWTHRINRGADIELTQAGYHPSLFSYSRDEQNAVPRLLSLITDARDRLAGILCFLSPPVFGLIDELDRLDIPWVTINRPREGAVHNFVTHDAFGGSRLIGRCLARLKADRIAILSDAMMPGKSSADKYFGFMQGYIERGMPSRGVDFIECERYFEQDGYNYLRAYIQQHGPPKAVVTSGDLLAAGAMRLLRELDIKVPGQVGVIGSTGLKMAEYTHPSLTVLPVPMEQMGQAAAQMLVEMSREGVRRLVGRYVPAPLVVRESLRIPEELIAEESVGLHQPAAALLAPRVAGQGSTVALVNVFSPAVVVQR